MMEVRIGEYGQMMFQIMTSENSGAEHWESIRKEAEPLVKELIKLNAKMKGGGYKLIGFKDESGKTILPDHRRIEIAQEKLWSVSTSELKQGDRIWLIGEEPEMHVGETRPAPVDEVTDKNVYITLNNWEDYTQKLSKSKSYFVLRAPKDWDKKEEVYSSDEYWLKQADKLAI